MCRIENKTEKAIKKYATYYKRYGSNLDRLERIQRDLEREEEDKIRNENLPYSEMCDKISRARNIIEGVFDKYFAVSRNLYCWINGNNNFKELVTSKK